jgi:hypothetical protein
MRHIIPPECHNDKGAVERYNIVTRACGALARCYENTRKRRLTKPNLRGSTGRSSMNPRMTRTIKDATAKTSKMEVRPL